MTRAALALALLPLLAHAEDRGAPVQAAMCQRSVADRHLMCGPIRSIDAVRAALPGDIAAWAGERADRRTETQPEIIAQDSAEWPQVQASQHGRVATTPISVFSGGSTMTFGMSVATGEPAESAAPSAAPMSRMLGGGAP